MSEEINKIYNKIKVTFEYGNQKVTLDCEPYKTIGETKNKAMRKIYGANKGLHCFYLNRDLYRKENEKLGNFFPKRENITLKLMMPIRIPGEKDDYKDEFFGEPLLNTNLFSNNYNNSNGIKYVTNPNNLKNNVPKKPYKKVIKVDSKLEANLNPSKSYALSTRNNKALPSFIAYKDSSDEGPNYFCNNCNKKTINFFCRNCQDFLCEECKKIPKHNNHLTIKIDPFNLEENIKLYIMIVQTDIEQNIHANEEYYRQFYNNENSIDNESYRNKLITKLEELANLYNNIVQKLKETYSKNDHEGMDMLINEYNLNSRIISGELNNILTDLYTNFTQSRKKMGFTQFKSYINMINEKEKNWNAITKNIIVFKVNNDINEKVKKLYEKIEKEIDELTNIKRPFCLEKKELEFIDKRCGISKEETLIKNEEEENERMKESQILKERTEKQMKNKKEKEMLEKKEIKSIQDSSDDSESDSILSSEEENKKRNPGKRKTGNGKK